MKNILTIAVHPDDETLGCGGTLLRHKAEGSSIHWLILTAIFAQENGRFKTITSTGKEKVWDNGSAIPVAFPSDKVKDRSQELKRVSNAYGFDTVHELCLPAMSIDQIPMSLIISQISSVINELQPATVILPFHADVHSDHRVAFDAAYSCTKSFRCPFIKKIIMMETISETDFAPAIKENAFTPNLYVDITHYIDRKIEVMSLYQDETAKHPYPRSEDHIRAIAMHRGAAANMMYAESFIILKEIV